MHEVTTGLFILQLKYLIILWFALGKGSIMAIATINFHKLLQDSQEYGSNDEFMISRVFFDLTVNGKTYKDLFSNIKQAVGGTFESSNFEVSYPTNYDGPFNYSDFQTLVEKYVRSIIGSRGSGINLSDSAKNIRMYNNTFNAPYTTEFEIKDNK